ncbi:MAG: Hercynine oxygenase [Anaerolineae bacterium]|nr:Hercynine oxygenase [Anaerolineae bacterium]
MFNTDIWQQQIEKELAGLKGWLKQRYQKDAPNLVYGTLLGATLWPAVEAAAQTGQWTAVIGALTGIASGVGADLLAGQITRWKEQADNLTRDDVADWAAQTAAPHAELRDTLNQLLAELQVVNRAETRLAEADRAWLARTLRQELVQLGTPQSNIALVLSSDNVVLTGNHIKAGDGAIIGSKAGGHQISGSHNTIIARQIVQGQPGPEADTLLKDYLHTLFEDCRQLPLSQLDKTVTHEIEAAMNLSSVYTALLTTTSNIDGNYYRIIKTIPPDSMDSQRQSALEMLNAHKYLVLLGDPGSGKTTFVNFVTLCLAGHRLTRREANLERLTAPLPDDDGNDRDQPQPWQHGPLLPVRVILRDFAARGLPPAGETATASHLWNFITAELTAAKLEKFSPYLEKLLHEQDSLLLLDGLDEVPEANQRREQLKQAVEGFRRSFSRCRILVTSRTYAYQDEAWKLPQFEVSALVPFSKGQIIRFVDRWYEHVVTTRRGLTTAEAHDRASLLKRTIFDKPRLRTLAERPLLLAQMAQLHSHGQGSLPERRERLYAEMVDLLLDKWERPKLRRTATGQLEVEQPALTQWLGVDQERVLRFLEKLAFEVHRDQPDQADTADISQERLVTGLLELSQSRDQRFDMWQLIDYLEGRAGLLVPHGQGVYRFPHRTFQEYLAARYLSDYKFPAEVARLARTQPERWREVALLTGAKAAGGSQSSIWSLARKLCWQNPPANGEPPAEAMWGAHLAGQALVETANLDDVDDEECETLDRVRAWLKVLLGAPQLPAPERAAAGRQVAVLGDDRPGVGLLPNGLPDIVWCDVPAGPFKMGSDKKVDNEAFDDELPQHAVDLPAFNISRYPVTNAQYDAFVRSGGYGEQRYWPQAEAAGFWREGQVKDVIYYFDDKDKLQKEERGWRSGPVNFGPPYTSANHPAVGVSWYEALAFCHWLTEQLANSEFAPESLPVEQRRVWIDLQSEIKNQKSKIGLPSEAEWEKAARGIAGQIFPWGDAADPERANYKDTGIDATSAVGCFPHGKSRYGCEEMSGNVWEWTRSLWGTDRYNVEFTYPYNKQAGREDLSAGTDVLRIVRGGSFFDYAQLVRCAVRYRNYPDNWNWSLGFRVVVSPFF